MRRKLREEAWATNNEDSLKLDFNEITICSPSHCNNMFNKPYQLQSGTCNSVHMKAMPTAFQYLEASRDTHWEHFDPSILQS